MSKYLKILTLTLFLCLANNPLFAFVPFSSSYTVNTLQDTYDTSLSDGKCEDIYGNCSLRAALAQSKRLLTFGSSRKITISLKEGKTYTLTKGELTVSAGTITITPTDTNGDGIIDPATIEGTGSDRVLSVNAGANLTLEYLIITKGHADYGTAGGIVIGSSSDSTTSTLTITDSQITNNESGDSSYGYSYGGGLSLFYTTATFTNVEITENHIESNNWFSYGAGIYIYETDLTLTESLVNSNTITELDSCCAVSGGGIAITNNSTLTMEQSEVSSNEINNNEMGGFGAGLSIDSSSEAIIQHSLFNSNTISIEGSGGGVFNMGQCTIINSTITGNILNSSGSATDAAGGGLSSLFGNCDISFSTISFNEANSAGGILNSTGTVNIKNTILSDNVVSTTSPDCSGTLTSYDYNLIEDISDCTFSTLGHDLTGSDPGLDPLADNGGPTWTHEIDSGDLPRDAGGAPPCLDIAGNEITDDQRGEVRPALQACDIGAFEDQI